MAVDTSDILKKVRQIEIKTKGLSNNIFAGEYHSAFKGRGMAFSEVREYQYGDDIRDIEWNVTARFNKPYVKVFEEERELTVMLLIDVSGSLDFGTQKQTKREMVTEIAATLAFSAIQNNDKIGVIFFTDKVEKFIPPKKGRKHILYIISDFIDKKDFCQTLSIANRKHDVVAIQVYDKRIAELPNIGLVKMRDAENGVDLVVDTSSKKVRDAQHRWWMNINMKLKDTFNRSNVDSVSIRTDQDYVSSLMSLFAQRG